MSTTRRTLVRALCALGMLVAAPHAVRAQDLGPFRQFLAIEPYYTRIMLDQGANVARDSRNGYGGRLWINLAPFTGKSWILPSNGAIALSAAYLPRQGSDSVSYLTFGAQHDAFFSNRPYGGFLDPFLSVGAGGLVRRSLNGDHTTRFTLSPGGGIRIPIPNRLQLRVDARDLMMFGVRQPANSASRMTNSLELIGAIGITF